MKDLTVIVVLSLCLTGTQVIKKAMANPDAGRLYSDLLSNYNRLIRPVSKHTEIVTIKLGLRLSQIVDLVSTGSSKSNDHFLYQPFSILSKWIQTLKIFFNVTNLILN